MCLYVKNEGKPLIAKRNFVVSKFLFADTNIEKRKTQAESPYQQFIYKFGKTYTVNMAIDRKRTYYPGDAVNEGLHSKVKGIKGLTDGQEYYAIIPKGALYILGNSNDIVSNKLIVKKRWVRTKK